MKAFTIGKGVGFGLRTLLMFSSMFRNFCRNDVMRSTNRTGRATPLIHPLITKSIQEEAIIGVLSRQKTAWKGSTGAAPNLSKKK
jgi:hypothetical protein